VTLLRERAQVECPPGLGLYCFPVFDPTASAVFHTDEACPGRQDQAAASVMQHYPEYWQTLRWQRLAPLGQTWPLTQSE